MKRWCDLLSLDRLALPSKSIKFWICLSGILFSFQELGRAFPKSVLEFLISLYNEIWGKAPIGQSILCRPMGVLPQISLQKEIKNSRTDLGNLLPSSWKLIRIPQKHTQELVNICGRANSSRASLLDYLFIELQPFKNSASPSEGLRQPSHYS